MESRDGPTSDRDKAKRKDFPGENRSHAVRETESAAADSVADGRSKSRVPGSRITPSFINVLR